MQRFTYRAMQTFPLCTLPRRRKHFGGIALAMIATLLVVAATTLAIRMTQQVEDRRERVTQTQARMERIRAALHAFAVTQGRLPCPVAGATSDYGSTGAGLADPPGPSVIVCAAKNGTVPWVSLGLRSEEAQDAWGRKISYRVFDDLVKDDGVKNTTISVGLSVKDGAVIPPHTGLAWVLISHGVSGLGAWLPNGQPILPTPASQELANTQPTGPFVRREESVVDLDPATSLPHFDDLLLFESIDELKKWVGIDLEEETVTGDVIKKLLEDPNAIDTKGNGSGLTFIDLVTPDLGTVRISSTGGDISTDGPYKALGVCSSGCGAGNISNRALDSTESLSFRLGTGKTAKSFALGLLGISNTTVAVSITFKKDGATLGNLIQSVAVTTAMPASPQLTNLALTPPGTEFDEVVVQPVGASRFFVASVFFCQAGTCPSP